MRTACAEAVAVINKCSSDPARDESRDTQNAPESYEKQTARLLQQILSLEDDRAQRQDQVAKTILLAFQTLKERQDSMQLSLETVKKQLSDLHKILRRSEQLSLPPNTQYTQGQGARTDPLSMSGRTQYAPPVRSEHLSYSGNTEYVPSL
jgi:hypothetical protein